MSELINAIDNFTTKQYGENGHIEYGESNNIREKIIQFNFQLVRNSDDSQLKQKLKNILSILKNKLLISKKQDDKEIFMQYLLILYKMIGQTRDIIGGKGEYKLSYMMIYTWYEFYPELSLLALNCFCNLEKDNKSIHPYGSWKDIKYFCEYCKNENISMEHPLIQYSIELLNTQIRMDINNLNLINENKNHDKKIGISLAAKWAPRENSKFGWLFELLATNYFSEYMSSNHANNSESKAVKKCKTHYRKILSSLNKYIDTLQIKQCHAKWSEIDFNKVTSISLVKQRKAFLNISNNAESMNNITDDRLICSNNFRKYIQESKEVSTKIKGHRVSMSDFTKQAIEILELSEEKSLFYKEQADLINMQWNDNADQNKTLSNMIAMVDVSDSMGGYPMNAAISLGIRIAEKSIIGNRVMTFSSSPSWVNLEPYNDFISKVKIVKDAPWGTNTNFYSALDMILNAIIENKMEPEMVQDMILVILSDMQIDQADNQGLTLYENIEAKYAIAGIRIHGKPFKPPHILFWNLRSTSGYPVISNQQNTSMLSGYSPVLLNLFCENGVNAFNSCTPWYILEKSLSNERYNIMEQSFFDYFYK
jgi:hypothetical protein